jgi:hypothetical protein
MNQEQVSLSFTILPDGTLTACVSAMPFVDGALVPEAQASRIVGSHNVNEDADARFVASVSSAIAAFRAEKNF